MIPIPSNHKSWNGVKHGEKAVNSGLWNTFWCSRVRALLPWLRPAGHVDGMLLPCCSVLCHSLWSGCSLGVLPSGRHAAMLSSKQTHDLPWFIPFSRPGEKTERFSEVTCPPSQCPAAARSRTSLRLLGSLGQRAPSPVALDNSVGAEAVRPHHPSWNPVSNGPMAVYHFPIRGFLSHGGYPFQSSRIEFNGFFPLQTIHSGDPPFVKTSNYTSKMARKSPETGAKFSSGLHHGRRQRVLLCPGPPLKSQDGMILGSQYLILNIYKI